MLDGQVPWGETGLQEEEEISQMILTQKDTYITNKHIQLLQTLCNVLFEAYDRVEKLGDICRNCNADISHAEKILSFVGQ